MEKVAEMLEGTKVAGKPETRTSTIPPIDVIDEGLTWRTEATESSTTEKKDERHEVTAPVVDDPETLTAKVFTEIGELTTIETVVLDALDGSKNVFRTVADMSSKGAG
jgi:hypothetical protein